MTLGEAKKSRSPLATNTTGHCFPLPISSSGKPYAEVETRNHRRLGAPQTTRLARTLATECHIKMSSATIRQPPVSFWVPAVTSAMFLEVPGERLPAICPGLHPNTAALYGPPTVSDYGVFWPYYAPGPTHGPHPAGSLPSQLHRLTEPVGMLSVVVELTAHPTPDRCRRLGRQWDYYPIY
jgi:hypothetical protein